MKYDTYGILIYVLRLMDYYGDGECYRKEIQKTMWEIPKRYQSLQAVGSGTYGTVCSAVDNLSNRAVGYRVAIKKLNRPFQTTVHAKRTYRELKLLRLLKHENVIDLLDVFTPDPAPEEMTDVYLVSTLLVTDLEKIMKRQRLTSDQIEEIVYQIVRGLKYVHSAGVIHRDLKPSNIAINSDRTVKIIDFGLARHSDLEMTGYVSTRWYRAPEIMLNWRHYDRTADIWSLGCIMAEMLLGHPLFAGDDDIDQLTRIVAVLGTPTEDFLQRIESQEARKYIRRMPRRQRQEFTRVFPDAGTVAIDLLERMLQIDAAYRPSASVALRHDYLKQFHIADDEPTIVGSASVDLDDESLPTGDIYEWKKKIWVEIEDIRSQIATSDSL